MIRSLCRRLSKSTSFEKSNLLSNLIARKDVPNRETCWTLYPSYPSGCYSNPKACPPPKKVMRVELYLSVENNSKFVRGKTRSLAEIEDDILSRYGMEKPKNGRPDYLLSIPYETDEELDRLIYDDILNEAQFIADLRHGHISYDMWEEGNPERSW